MIPWSSLWKAFFPCPWGVVRIFLHVFHGCCWILALCFYSAFTQGTLGFTPLADRTNMKGRWETSQGGVGVGMGHDFSTEAHAWQVGKGRFAALLERRGLCVFLMQMPYSMFCKGSWRPWEKNVLCSSVLPASNFLQLLWRGDKWAAEPSPP